MTVGLAMIVKDEEQTLPRLAASLKDQVHRVTIVDTGSTDNTVKVAQQVFDPVPTEVLLSEWFGFGIARNMALMAAHGHTDWIMWADADETMHGRIEADDLYNCIETLEHFMNLRYWMPRLITGPGWEWKGRCHEYLDRPGMLIQKGRSDTFWFEHHADGGARANKAERDMGLLMADWEEHHDARSAFYIARTYDDMGQPNMAVGWYRTRVMMPGWAEETFYARYRLGKCLLDIGAYDEGCGALWAAWGEQPHRAEPLVTLAEYYRQRGLWHLAWQASGLAMSGIGEGLFVDLDTYEWKAEYERSIAAWYVGERETGRVLTGALLNKRLPPEIHRNLISNNAFYA